MAPPSSAPTRHEDKRAVGAGPVGIPLGDDRPLPDYLARGVFARLARPVLRISTSAGSLARRAPAEPAYDAGHVPGAIFLDLDSNLAAPSGPGRHPLPDPRDFRERLEAAGIGTSDEVVAYDDAGGSIAARLWWMLDNLGHARASVLDGGIGAWLAAGYPVTSGLVARPTTHASRRRPARSRRSSSPTCVRAATRRSRETPSRPRGRGRWHR